MKRRSRAGGEPIKTQRRKTIALKSRITPKALRPRSSSAALEETKVARLTRERDEALQQQRATADVLRSLAARPSIWQKVLNTLLEFAARVCEADGVYPRPAGRREILLAASFRHTPEFIEQSEWLNYLRRDAAVYSAEFSKKANLFKFRMSLPILNGPYGKPQNSAAFAQFSASRFFERGFLLAFFSCIALRFGRSPRSRSSWSKPSPTRR